MPLELYLQSPICLHCRVLMLPLSGVYYICTLQEHILFCKLVFACVCYVIYTLFSLTVCNWEWLFSSLHSVHLCYFHIKIQNLIHGFIVHRYKWSQGIITVRGRCMVRSLQQYSWLTICSITQCKVQHKMHAPCFTLLVDITIPLTCWWTRSHTNRFSYHSICLNVLICTILLFTCNYDLEQVRPQLLFLNMFIFSWCWYENVHYCTKVQKWV